MRKKLTINEQNHIDYVKLKLKELLNMTDCLEVIKENPNYQYMLHVIAHRDAFARLESHTSYHGVFSPEHDIDKVGLGLILGKDIAKSIHKKTAPHHNIDWSNPDSNIIVEKMFDWESCHYTKTKAPETAYEHTISEHSDKINIVSPILNELGLWGKRNEKPLKQSQYQHILNSIHGEHIMAELRKSYAYIQTHF
jgi:hypothetical protein